MKIIHLATVDSTNNYAKNLAKTLFEDALIIADNQTAGRGRMGRTFSSREGGIYMSLILHPKTSADFSVKITTMACVAVRRAILSVCNIETKIKWVNDIYLGNKKVCGILTEGAIDPKTKKLNYVVLGVGINVFRPKGGFDEDIKDIATSLYDEEKQGIKEEIINTFVKEFLSILNEKSSNYMEEYKSSSIILGKNIEYIKDNARYKAKAVDINEKGELIVESNGKTAILNAGEIKIDMTPKENNK